MVGWEETDGRQEADLEGTGVGYSVILVCIGWVSVSGWQCEAPTLHTAAVLIKRLILAASRVTPSFVSQRDYPFW